MRVTDTHGVGAQDLNAGLACGLNELLLEIFAFLVGFTESRGNQQHTGNAFGLQLGKQGNDTCCRNGDNCQVDIFLDVRHGRVYSSAGNFAPLGVDQVDFTLKAAADGVGYQDMAPLAQRR